MVVHRRRRRSSRGGSTPQLGARLLDELTRQSDLLADVQSNCVRCLLNDSRPTVAAAPRYGAFSAALVERLAAADWDIERRAKDELDAFRLTLRTAVGRLARRVRASVDSEWLKYARSLHNMSRATSSPEVVPATLNRSRHDVERTRIVEYFTFLSVPEVDMLRTSLTGR